jgi:hypothetical protein
MWMMHDIASSRIPVPRRLIVIAAVLGAMGFAAAQPTVTTVFYDMPPALMPQMVPAPSANLLAVQGYPNDPARMTFIARLYLPDPAVHGAGPHPVVLFLHGSGGLWPSGNTIPANLTANNSPTQQFRDWGNLLVSLGYACLFPDSFHPRGITGSFEGRRPHYDPAEDDAACSPNYERPKDVIAAMTYLASRPEVDAGRLAIVGFSHGAQTGMNALVDASVDLGDYTVDKIALVDNGQGGQIEDEVELPVPDPVRIPDHLPMPKFGAFYYGGGGHFGYHGSPSSTAAGRYMLDRRTPAILFHGIDDYLLDVDDPAADPMTGPLYPIKQVLASAAQAATLGLANPIRHHYLMDRCAYHQPGERVEHSFDLGSVGFAQMADWNTVNESPNRKARRLARDEVLRWLAFTLQPAPVLSISRDPNPPHDIILDWPTHGLLGYRLLGGESPDAGSPATNWTDGTGQPFQHSEPVGIRRFFRLAYRPQEMPVNAPEHAGFFRDYSDFDL